MDAISNILPAISGGVSTLGSAGTPTWEKLLGLGAGGAGAVGNILASNKRNQVLNQQLDVQKQLMAMTPEQLAAGIQQLTRPLSAGLTSSVGNAVQGYLAERGLSQSPGIATEALAQGLAPYQLQEQQMATQAYLQKLGLPAQAAARFLPYPQSTDLSKLFQILFTKPSVPGGNQSYGDIMSSPGNAYQPTLQQLTGLDTSGAVDPTGGSNPISSGSDWMSLIGNNGFDPSAMFNFGAT